MSPSPPLWLPRRCGSCDRSTTDRGCLPLEGGPHKTCLSQRRPQNGRMGPVSPHAPPRNSKRAITRHRPVASRYVDGHATAKPVGLGVLEKKVHAGGWPPSHVMSPKPSEPWGRMLPGMGLSVHPPRRSQRSTSMMPLIP